MIDIEKMAIDCYYIATDRAQNDPLKHCAGEIVEAVDARDKWSYLYKDKIYSGILCKETADKELRKEFAYELADIIICVLTELVEFNLHEDFETYLKEKIEINRQRIPKDE